MLAAIYNVALWAQNPMGKQPMGKPGGDISQADMNAFTNALASAGIGVAIFALLITVFAVMVQWKIFTKAGEPGWASLVPIYNMMILSKICGRGEAFGLLMLVPCVNIVIAIMLVFDLAKVFGKSGGFAVGMLLFGIVFYPILAFGSAQYIGADGKSPGRKRGRDDDDEDDEEDERPRRSAGKDPRTQQRPSSPPSSKRRPADDDDEEEEERPRPRGR